MTSLLKASLSGKKPDDKMVKIDGECIATCMKSKNFGNVASCTLHDFPDVC